MNMFSQLHRLMNRVLMRDVVNGFGEYNKNVLIRFDSWLYWLSLKDSNVCVFVCMSAYYLSRWFSQKFLLSMLNTFPRCNVHLGFFLNFPPCAIFIYINMRLCLVSTPSYRWCVSKLCPGVWCLFLDKFQVSCSLDWLQRLINSIYIFCFSLPPRSGSYGTHLINVINIWLVGFLYL